MQNNIFLRHVALPSEHGAWVFILSPLLIGLFAGKTWNQSGVYLVIASMTAFLLRQPVNILVKAYSGRRSKYEIPAALFWIMVYSIIGIFSLFELIKTGFIYVLLLAIPGVPVFAWHLYLISKRAERQQIGIELVGSGILSLAATAAYWVGVGNPAIQGWYLFVLCWLQSAASIVYAYLRLEQRKLKEFPDLSIRIKMGKRAFLYTTFNFVAVVIASVDKIIPPLLFIPFILQWIETMFGIVKPAIGKKPTYIGIRQLVISTIFTVLFVITWRIE